VPGQRAAAMNRHSSKRNQSQRRGDHGADDLDGRSRSTSGSPWQCTARALDAAIAERRPAMDGPRRILENVTVQPHR